jgi:hypothetical protein
LINSYSFHDDPEFLPAILHLFCMAIAHQDVVLCQAVFAEVQKVSNELRARYDSNDYLSELTSRFYLLQVRNEYQL